MTRLPPVFLACLMALLPLKASAQSAAATQWWADVSALADDGIVFDVTYAGRALAGLAAAIRSGAVRSGERTVLVHTGGVPGLFGHPGLFRAPRGPGQAAASRD